MHCINLMPKALRQGEEKGATILIGGKAPILQGALLSWVIVPFMKIEPPYEELKDLILKTLDIVGGNQVQAAKLLGVTRATLRNRIEKFGITRRLELG